MSCDWEWCPRCEKDEIMSVRKEISVNKDGTLYVYYEADCSECDLYITFNRTLEPDK